MDQDIFTADPRLRPQRAPADRSHCCHPVSYRKKNIKKTSREGVKCGEELFITVTNTTDYESYQNFVNLDYFNLILSVFRTDII